jgi:hypothetical protein
MGGGREGGHALWRVALALGEGARRGGAGRAKGGSGQWQAALAALARGGVRGGASPADDAVNLPGTTCTVVPDPDLIVTGVTVRVKN